MTALTVKDAILAPSPAYGFINQDSPTKARALLSVQITGLVRAFNVGKSMDANQIAECVKRILEDNNFRSFKPDDFKVCFTNLIKGHYGKVYDCMDEPTIFLALNAYLNERLDTVEQISIDRHKLELAGKMAEINPEGVKKLVEVMKSAVEEVKPHVKYKTDKVALNEKGRYDIYVSPVEKEKPTLPKGHIIIEKSDRDKFIQDCFREFGEILKQKGSLSKHGNHIEYKGKLVDETEYVQIKLKEYDKNLLAS